MAKLVDGPMVERKAVRRWCTSFALTVALLTGAAASADTPPGATPPPAGYLSDGVDKLGFTLDAPPAKNPDIERNQVLMAQLSADRYAKDEAYADADAYLADALIQRFSTAAGETLNRTRRPILAHMMFRIWRNLDKYSSDLKKLYPRDRPFVRDTTIQPCNVSFLQPSNGSSYPSGHAADGYAAALLLVDVMRGGGGATERDRTDLLLARGIRFGTNRMICGVHFPSDVAAGEAFAKALYAKISTTTSEFQADLACARVEEAADRNGDLTPDKRKSYPAECKAMADAYATEDHFS